MKKYKKEIINQYIEMCIDVGYVYTEKDYI